MNNVIEFKEESVKDLDIECRDFVVFNDLIFLDEDELLKYLETCNAKFTAVDCFAPTAEDLAELYCDEDDLSAQFEDNENPEAAYCTAAANYDNFVEDLLEKYEIEYVKRHKGSDSYYELSGRYMDLKKFAAEYTCDILMDHPGEDLAVALQKGSCKIDIDSGDKEFIIGKLTQ